MIRVLRRRHRIATTGLALIIPAILIVALRSRDVIPVSSGLPEALGGVSDPVRGDSIEVAGVWFVYDPAGPKLISIPLRSASLNPTDPRFGADVLLYWSPFLVESTDDLIEGFVIGQLRGNAAQSFQLANPGGFASLFSVAHDEVLGSVALPEQPDGA